MYKTIGLKRPPVPMQQRTFAPSTTSLVRWERHPVSLSAFVYARWSKLLPVLLLEAWTGSRVSISETLILKPRDSFPFQSDARAAKEHENCIFSGGFICSAMNQTNFCCSPA
ncbi:hypothetical protein MRB53_032514 [Persea americana]|uniref:Uncharacterized protein n=1 Tax=Persea americana TaxID=3435 RepID=A0ACC2KSM4_PERAE|nr:hypothetical protein MRB53_032514 [Persea americana]